MSYPSSQELFEMGYFLYQRGQYGHACLAFRKAVEANPEHAMALSYYGLTLAMTEKDYPRAIQLCEEALQKAFYRPELYLNLAKVYQRARNLPKALETLRKGLRVDPRNREIRDELARLQPRRQPVIRFLPREHALNRFLGQLMRRFQLRTLVLPIV